MRKRLPSLTAWLLAAAVSASAGVVETYVPVSVAPVSGAAAISATARPGLLPLAASALPTLAPALAVPVPAVAAPVPVKAAPAALAMPVLRAAASTGEKAAPAAAAAAFDGWKAPENPLAVEMPGVSFQIEQEGNLRHADPKDSSGNVFKYYKPVELRPELLKKAEDGLGSFDRFFYAVRTLRGWLTRADPAKVWRALPLAGKLFYVNGLEEAVAAERGPEAAWRGKNFLLLGKTRNAPDFVAEHPDMEEPPSGRRSGEERFIQPEIVSAKDKAAKTGREAIGRTRRVIGDTGHAGTQYHAFVKLAPEKLAAQLDGLLATVAAYNEVLFLEAAGESPDNLLHGSLRPWHAGRSRRVRALTRAAGPAHQPSWTDRDSEKHAYLGVRWWGLENGLAVISLELRGASLPFKRESPAMRGVEGSGSKMIRDYTHIERWLGTIATAAGRLSAGATRPAPSAEIELDEAAAAAALSKISESRGAPAVTVADLEALSASLGAGPGVHPALIYPLAAGKSAAYSEELWRWTMARKAGEADFNARLAKYSLWSSFGAWAAARLPSARASAGL
ncbi:MAG: hypothetical protein M0D55_08250 [Elusimicrobiota bacterium]|nr:MAG: hypothetical protein M0D55_08250 [Elusimicrobiota bacterium]